MLEERPLRPSLGFPRAMLRPGRVVWAKVEGHDWWPARIVRRRAVPKEVGPPPGGPASCQDFLPVVFFTAQVGGGGFFCGVMCLASSVHACVCWLLVAAYAARARACLTPPLNLTLHPPPALARTQGIPGEVDERLDTPAGLVAASARALKLGGGGDDDEEAEYAWLSPESLKPFQLGDLTGVWQECWGALVSHCAERLMTPPCAKRPLLPAGAGIFLCFSKRLMRLPPC